MVGLDSAEKLVSFLQQMLLEGVMISTAFTFMVEYAFVIPKSNSVGIINKNSIKYLMTDINK